MLVCWAFCVLRIMPGASLATAAPSPDGLSEGVYCMCLITMCCQAQWRACRHLGEGRALAVQLADGKGSKSEAPVGMTAASDVNLPPPPPLRRYAHLTVRLEGPSATLSELSPALSTVH